MLATPDGQEADEGDLHAGQGSQSVPSCVADVQPGAETAHADQHESMQGQQVGDEDVSTPRADHVSVEQRRQTTPHDASNLDGLDPEVEGEDQKEDGNCLVVVTSSDRSRDVAGGDAHEHSGEQTS